MLALPPPGRPLLEVIEHPHQSGRQGIPQLADARIQVVQEVVERDGRRQAHRRANQRDADLVGNLRGFHLVSGADAAERRHHSQHRAKQTQKRSALDDGCHPARDAIEVPQNVALQHFRHHLSHWVVPDVPVGNGDVHQLRQCSGVLGALVFCLLILTGSQLRHHGSHVLILLLVGPKAQLAHAHPSQHHAVQSP